MEAVASLALGTVSSLITIVEFARVRSKKQPISQDTRSEILAVIESMASASRELKARAQDPNGSPKDFMRATAEMDEALQKLRRFIPANATPAGFLSRDYSKSLESLKRIRTRNPPPTSRALLIAAIDILNTEIRNLAKSYSSK